MPKHAKAILYLTFSMTFWHAGSAIVQKCWWWRLSQSFCHSSCWHRNKATESRPLRHVKTQNLLLSNDLSNGPGSRPNSGLDRPPLGSCANSSLRLQPQGPQTHWRHTPLSGSFLVFSLRVFTCFHLADYKQTNMKLYCSSQLQAGIWDFHWAPTEIQSPANECKIMQVMDQGWEWWIRIGREAHCSKREDPGETPLRLWRGEPVAAPCPS